MGGLARLGAVDRALAVDGRVPFARFILAWVASLHGERSAVRTTRLLQTNRRRRVHAVDGFKVCNLAPGTAHGAAYE